jgi:hypothetical protein
MPGSSEPDKCKAQIEGGIIMGISLSSKEQITLTARYNNAIMTTTNLLRMQEVPDSIEQVLSRLANGASRRWAKPSTPQAGPLRTPRLTANALRHLPHPRTVLYWTVKVFLVNAKVECHWGKLRYKLYLIQRLFQDATEPQNVCKPTKIEMMSLSDIKEPTLFWLTSEWKRLETISITKTSKYCTYHWSRWTIGNSYGNLKEEVDKAKKERRYSAWALFSYLNHLK